MIRILHIGMSSNPGGVENFIMNLYRNINRNEIQFDFLVEYNASKIAYEDEIKELGGNIYREYYRKKDFFVKGRKSIQQFFIEHKEISGIHMHFNVLHSMFDILEVAKKNNISLRIVHSHNDGYMNIPKFKNWLYEIYAKKKLNRVATKLLACSKNAGEWMFNNNNFLVINNSVNIQNFKFNSNQRENIRKKLKIEEDVILVGTVIRLNYQKNPLFLIKVFYELYKSNKNYKLLIIGDGDLKKKVLKKIKKYNIQDNVILLGSVNNVSPYLNAMDLFLFPSRFEGFGIALLEAQINGLMCYASNVIPNEVKCTNNLKFISLKLGEKKWMQEIVNTLNLKKERYISSDCFENFNITKNIKIMEKIYKNE